MSKFKRNAFLLTCILSLQIIKPATSLYANTTTLTYNGKQYAYNKPPITLQIDNENIHMPIMPPVQIDGRTLVPTREVFEPMGASVEWKTAEKKVFINHGNTLMILEVDNQEVWIDGESAKLDVPPMIINDKLMLPLRFIGETLGYKVDWDHDTSNISIQQTRPVPDNPEPEVSTPVLQTQVEDVRVQSSNSGASLYTIHFQKPIDSYTHFTEAEKVVVDINNAKNLLASNITLPDNLYVHTVRTSQFTADKTRVVFDLKRGADSKIELSGDRMTLTIRMEAPIGGPAEEPIKEIELENIKYASNPRETIIFKKVPGLTVDSINVNDDYRNRKITVTLPQNYSSVYNDGLLNIGSSTLDKVIVQSTNKTEFIIHEKKIRAFDIIDDGENIKIIFMQPKEKYEKIILLDIGHGAHDGGASANGLVEKNVNFEQAMHVYELLKKDPNIKVYITREDDSYPTNPYRAQLANEIGVDIFVSMHNNSFTGDKANGTEILYRASDPRSKQIADILQKNMVSRLGTYDRKVKARDNILIFNSSNMPAVLIETAFLTNAEDAKRLKSAEFNQNVGLVVYESIIEIFNTLSFR